MSLIDLPFLGELRIVAFPEPPNGWALCDGQELPIAQNQALFSLIGTTYGGNGFTTFGLPDFRGRVPIHAGNGFFIGNNGGAESHSLTINEMPVHTHLLKGVSADADSRQPAGHLPGSTTEEHYGTGQELNLHGVALAGGSVSHENIQPYLVLNVIIALEGIFPERP